MTGVPPSESFGNAQGICITKNSVNYVVGSDNGSGNTNLIIFSQWNCLDKSK
jgi:hypothetical protein